MLYILRAFRSSSLRFSLTSTRTSFPTWHRSFSMSHPTASAQSHSTTNGAGNTHRNRLASAKSPYLLQHQHNPVDWYEWTPEAFEEARTRNVPIFLSVGYSACHWCHVLAHESFEDPEVAKLMNEKFVNIKVDREERPDVDSLYMTFLQATVGGGGWPLSAFLTPTLHPFFAGTYFPRSTFVGLLNKISDLWTTKESEVISSAESILTQLRETSDTERVDTPSIFLVQEARQKLVKDLRHRFDPAYGGFSSKPKFPSPSQTLDFLSTYIGLPPPGNGVSAMSRNDEAKTRAVEMGVKTLKGIWEGGIRDHVGNGIARYSVDERWHVPHFEKMLYDQSQVAISALDFSLLCSTRQSATDSEDRAILQALAADVLTYAERDLRDPSPSGGAFWSAEDADSKPSFDPSAKSLEGAFYVWTTNEVHEALGSGIEANLIKARFGMSDDGNVDPASDIQGELKLQNVLFIAKHVPQLAENFNISLDETERILQESITKLKAWRDEHRPRPHLDDKVVTAWNGLMISAYARASVMLDPENHTIQSRSLALAEGTVAFVLREMLDPETLDLCRSWRAGEKGPKAQTDDYAFLIQGLLDLYDASGKEEHLILAIRLQEKQDQLFVDEKDGGYFSSAEDPHILIRQKTLQDGAEPSAVSITLSNLSRFSHLDTSRLDAYNTRIESTIGSLSSLIERSPRFVANSIAALLRHQSGYTQFIVVGSPKSPTVNDFLRVIRKRFIPNRIIIHINPDNPPVELSEKNEVVKAIVDEVRGGKVLKENVRLCEGFTCRLPVYTVEDVENLVVEMLDK